MEDLTAYWKEIETLDREAGDVIDSSWHFSWHWPRDQYGRLTAEGWEKAKEDASTLRASLGRRVLLLDRIVPRIEAAIIKTKEWEGE